VTLGDGVSLQFPGNSIKAPLGYREAMEFVSAARAPFTAAALPDSLDAGRKIALVQRLVRGGLLKLANAGRQARELP
jgi:hypothetical protein